MTRQMHGTVRDNVTFDDFAKVFRVFESFPFYEKWTLEEIRAEYESFMNGGFIFGYFTHEGCCVAILTMRNYEPGEHPVDFDEGAKVVYLSDVATLFEYRNRGIGTHLFEHAIRHMKALGYDYIYLRTNEENSMSYGIAKKCGFTKMYDVIQEVERKRIDGVTKKDVRIFMQKKLK